MKKESFDTPEWKEYFKGKNPEEIEEIKEPVKKRTGIVCTCRSVISLLIVLISIVFTCGIRLCKGAEDLMQEQTMGWIEKQTQKEQQKQEVQQKISALEEKIIESLDYLKRKEWDKAKKLLDEILKEDPNCALAHMGLGAMYLGKGNEELSNYHFNQAKLLDPKMWKEVTVPLKKSLPEKQSRCSELKREQFTKEEWERMKKLGIVPDEEKETRERRARETEAKERSRSLRTEIFEIIEPKWDVYSAGLGSNFYHPSISFIVQNIGSLEIERVIFKATFVYKKDNTMMSQQTTVIENLPPGYKSVKQEIISPGSWKLFFAVHASEYMPEMDVRLYWAKSYGGPWKELPNFSKYCKKPSASEIFVKFNLW